MNVFTYTEKMERGQYPINIPTSLALESLMNIHPEIKHPSPPYQNYDEYWLNLRTLYRNVTSSYTSAMSALMSGEVIAELMTDEWAAISKLIRDNTRIKPVLYLCDYRQIETRYRQHTNFKRDTKQSQTDERVRMTRAISRFLKDNGDDFVERFDTDIKPENKDKRFIIQTHLVVDLLSKKFFGELDLLESHTGAIKNQSLWYTKYNNGKDLSMFPFTHYFLRIFGDKEFFSPKDLELRRDLIALATKYRWNSLTTDSRVRMGLDDLKNPFFKAVVKDMM